MSKDEQIENIRSLASHLNKENIALREQLKNCNKQNVSKQKGLLADFMKFYNYNVPHGTMGRYTQIIDKFINRQ